MTTMQIPWRFDVSTRLTGTAMRSAFFTNKLFRDYLPVIHIEKHKCNSTTFYL